MKTIWLPFKIQLQCGNCIEEYNKIDCGRCGKDFDCKKMNFLYQDDEIKKCFYGCYDETKILCNRYIKFYTKFYDKCNTKYNIQKYNKDINVKSKNLKYRLIDEQIKHKNN